MPRYAKDRGNVLGGSNIEDAVPEGAKGDMGMVDITSVRECVRENGNVVDDWSGNRRDQEEDG